MNTRKIIALFVALVLAAALFAGCGGGGGSGEADKGSSDNAAQSDTFTMSLRMDLASLNPLNMQLESENMVMPAMFMPLFFYAVNADEARSDACDNWDVSEDATVYKFTLKDGITFHNGEKLTMDDVVYSINAAAQSPAQSVWAGNFKSAEVTGDREVTITLAESDANFLRTANIFLLSEKTVKDMGDDFDLNPVGCGPYKFVSFEAGYQLKLEAFEDYIGPAVEFKNAVYTIQTDPSSTVIALENGETDAIASTAYVQYQSLQDNENIDVKLIESAVDMFIMNTKVKPFDDVKVRQAMNYAIDKEGATQAFTEGVAPVATSLIPWLKDESLTGYPYDPEKAKALLAEAGYPNGEGFPEVKIQTIDDYKIYAQVIQKDLTAIGITAEVELGEATALTEALISGNVPFSIFGISLGFNTSQYNQILVTDQPYNLAFYSNPEIDELFANANKELDAAKSKQLYIDILKKAQDEAVYGMLADTVIMYAYNNAYDFSTAFDNFSSAGIRPQDIKKAA